MLRTLYGKLAVTLLALLSLLGIIFLVVNLFSTRMFLQEINQGLHRDLAAHLVEESRRARIPQGAGVGGANERKGHGV